MLGTERRVSDKEGCVSSSQEGRGVTRRSVFPRVERGACPDGGSLFSRRGATSPYRRTWAPGSKDAPPRFGRCASPGREMRLLASGDAPLPGGDAPPRFPEMRLSRGEMRLLSLRRCASLGGDAPPRLRGDGRLPRGDAPPRFRRCASLRGGGCASSPPEMRLSRGEMRLLASGDAPLSGGALRLLRRRRRSPREGRSSSAQGRTVLARSKSLLSRRNLSLRVPT